MGFSCVSSLSAADERQVIENGVVHSPYPEVPPVKDATVFAFLKNRIRHRSNKTALICDSEAITHGEVLERLERCAAVYQMHGIGKGDRVYAHVLNSIDNFICICAIPLTGATLVTSDVLFREGELLANLHNSDATHVLTDTTFAPLFNDIKHKYAFKVNLISATPQKLLKIAEAAKATGMTLPTVKKFRTQGIFLPERIAAEVVSVFAPDELRDCYGMTEVTGFLAVPPKGGTTARKRRIPRLRYKDESDLGYYDNDGRLFLAGRLKNTMFRMSKHMNPAEIEHCLYAHSAISEVAVLPVPREDTDDDPAAIIVLKEGVAGDQKLAEEIKAFVAERLAPYKHLHGGVFFADCIPKTSFGKFKRRLLPDMLKSLKRMDNPST
ncbi:hypothetical protein MTO96_039224 [Rhipicephalus appendiculatus]